ncbi:MAG TPA: sugar phosphate isomerase/epimerase family protein [Acidobacteriaceae bacterium]|nr:sugar phosphate isomerase/epimerase family protein [Acidobacteriaceae bacterium]
MSLLHRLSFNQMTADPWTLKEAVSQCAKNGVTYFAPWRHKLGADAARASALIRDAGLQVSSLCRGGWFSAPTPEERRKRIADNRAAIQEAAILGTKVLVIVSGPANGQTLDDARATVLDGLREVLPDAEKAGVVLGIEPLHPMYAAERSVVVALKQANDMATQLASPAAGVVIDVFHVWWDPEVYREIERSRGRIVGFHVSDWAVPLPGILMGRSMMGEGVIELRRLRQAVEAAGYSGPIEVEIFNDEIWATADDALIPRIQRAFLDHV